MEHLNLRSAPRRRSMAAVRWSAWVGCLARLRWSPALLSASSIQKIQHPFALVTRTTNGNRQHQAQHFPWPHHVDLPPRTDHLGLEHNKATDLLERLTERDVFTGIQSFGKSAYRAVRLPSAKEETASHPSDE